ncbi:MAG: hypothetical protein HXY22_07140 [Alphaproteobacteria bacterium]|nr:hypothetical protein [Alphaproteobacteria bacterium]
MSEIAPLSQETPEIMPEPEESIPSPQPNEAATRIEKWRRKAGRVNAAAVDAVLDDPQHRAVIQHAFAFAPELAECCIAHPAVVFAALRGQWRSVVREAFRDLSAIDRAWGPTESITTALRPIRDRVFATMALTALSGLVSDSDVHQTLTQTAERMIDATLNALVRRSIRHGQLPIAADPLPSSLQGLFVLGGGDFASGETGYAGPLDLAVVYDPVALQEIGISSIACERPLVHIAAELKEAFASPARGAPLFNVTLETIGIANHVRVALNADDVLYSIGLPPPQPRRAWFASARAVAGDKKAADAFLSRVHERLYTGRYGAVDLALASEDFTKTPVRPSQSLGGVPNALTRLLLCLRLVLGAKQPHLVTAPVRAVIAAARDAQILSGELADRLNDVIAIERAARDTYHLCAGAAQVAPGQSGRLRTAQAALAGFNDASSFLHVLEAAEEEAEAAWAALVMAAPIASKWTMEMRPSLVVSAAPNKLEALGFDDGASVALTIERWVPALGEGRPVRRMADLAPGLITAFAETDDPNGAVLRFDRFLAASGNEEDVFLALKSDPSLVGEVANVFGNAPAVAEAFIRSKTLIQAWPSWERGVDMLFSAPEWLASHVGEGPAALSGTALREWARDMKAQAACDVIGMRLDAADANAVFSAIAEATVQRAYDIVRAQYPEAESPSAGGIAVLSMGAFGGRMLSFDSPLELVFVSDVDQGGAATAEAAIRSAMFARDLLNELGADDAGEAVFSIDTTPRPGGQNGQLTTPMHAYLAHYGGPAAPAEHLALTRTRILIAPEHLRLKLSTGLRDILTRGRRTDRLAAEADRARHKLTRETDASNRWDLDAMHGGLGDIGLIAAALQLRNAADHPYVLSPDAGSAFSALCRAGCLDPDTAAELTETHRFYTRIRAILSIIGRSDLATRRPGPRLASLVARAAGVSEFASVEPLIQGHAERTMGHYKRLFLTPQPLSAPERRFTSFRSSRQS